MKRHVINIFIFPVALPSGSGVSIPPLPAKKNIQVLSTERNQTKKRILHHQKLLLLEKIGT
jgi:hypothetical protein